MPQCAWNEGCTEASVEKSKLCEVHRDEAIRLRKLKVEGWRMKKDARDREHLAKMSLMLAAEKDALLTVAREFTGEEIAGEIAVTAVSNRGAFTNYLVGANKGYIAQPEWCLVGGMAHKDLMGNLSLAAAKRYADEYNTRLTDVGISDVKAVPRI